MLLLYILGLSRSLLLDYIDAHYQDLHTLKTIFHAGELQGL